jgi:hypothetical protein
MENYSKTALSVGNLKEAALYFDHVVELSWAFEFITRGHHVASDVRNGINFSMELIPDSLRTNSDFLHNMIDIQLLSVDFMGGILEIAEHIDQAQQLLGWLESIEAAARRPEGLGAKDLVNISDKFPKAVQWAKEVELLVEKFRLKGLPVIAPSTFTSEGDSTADLALTLCNLHLIDVSSTSWQQITDFRKDSDARQKLRRLRLFAAETYSGKSRAYIEDDLSLRIQDYNEVVQRSGFETKQAALTMLLTSKPLGVAGVALGASLLSALFGVPITGVPVALGISGGATALVEIGKIGLEVSRRTFMLRNALQDNPVSYLVTARDYLRNENS